VRSIRQQEEGAIGRVDNGFSGYRRRVRRAYPAVKSQTAKHNRGCCTGSGWGGIENGYDHTLYQYRMQEQHFEYTQQVMHRFQYSDFVQNRCGVTVLIILYSYCTHYTVLILYSLYCTHTVLIILYSYCTHYTVLTLYSLYCTHTVLYSYCTVLILYSLYTHYTPTIHPLYTHYTPTIHPLYTHYTLTLHSLYTHYTLTIHSLYTHSTLTIHSLYTHYTLTIHPLYRCEDEYDPASISASSPSTYFVHSKWPFMSPYEQVCGVVVVVLSWLGVCCWWWCVSGCVCGVCLVVSHTPLITVHVPIRAGGWATSVDSADSVLDPYNV
jgi:hypothetical protein